MNRIRRVVLITVCASLVLFTRSNTVAQAPEQTASAAQDIDAFVARVMDTGLTPGLAVGVVRGANVIYAKGFGLADREHGRPVNADTLFYLASTTKSFTALAAAVLTAQAAIDLDRRLSDSLPGVTLHPALSPETITLRDLLTHTHGIRPGGGIDLRTAYSGDFTNDQLLRLLPRHPPAASGRSFAYSNVGYNIFSLVLDARFKEGWKEVLQRTVFAPLGMNSTTAWMSKADSTRLALPYEYRGDRPERIAYAKDDANMHAAGGHLSSVNDLVRYLQAELNDGRIGNEQALPAGVIAGTHRKLADQARTFGPFQRVGWSLGWDMALYEGDSMLQRFGDFPGFRSHVSFMPERAIGVVVLVNGGGASSALADLVATYVYDRLLDKPGLTARYDERLNDPLQQVQRAKKDLATRQARPQTTPLPWSAYVGAYESEALGRMIWTLENGRLQVRMGIARGDVEVYDGPRFQLRTTLTGAGSVATFVVPEGADRPTALRWFGETFTRVD
jgi:CubicO group peptidase (beta-lactamase class C family)